MKTNKLSLMTMIALGGVMALAPVMRAQENTENDAKAKAPQRERGARPKRMTEELKLTDDQKVKFEATMKEQTEKRRELSQNADLSAEEKRTKARELRQELAAKMKTILEADQFEKWEKMQQAGVRVRADRGARRAAPADKPAGDKPVGDKPAQDK